MIVLLHCRGTLDQLRFLFYPISFLMILWPCGSLTLRFYDITLSLFDSRDQLYDPPALRIFGSTTLRFYGYITLSIYDPAALRIYNSKTLQFYGCITLSLCNYWIYVSATIGLHESAAVRIYGFTTLRLFSSRALRLCDSITLRRITSMHLWI